MPWHVHDGSVTSLYPRRLQTLHDSLLLSPVTAHQKVVPCSRVQMMATSGVVRTVLENVPVFSLTLEGLLAFIIYGRLTLLLLNHV